MLVAVRQSGAGHRGGTLAVRMNRGLDSIDPAVAYDTTSIPILRMTNDGLVAFNQAGGLAGTQLVPNLAVSLPTPTDGGKTYTFRLRPNIRYSNGAPVKAADFRRAFERDFAIGKLPVTYYDGIVGAAQCKEAPKHCDLSRGIVTNDAARTVTFHLVEPDPEFLYQLALEFGYAVPATTPLTETHTKPLPGTGPYMIASYRPDHRLVLRRNPYFHEWSKAAQPDGYPDRIVFAIGGTPDAAMDDVIAGRADAFSTAQSQTPPSASRLAAVKLRHASQVHSNPQQATIALFLNTRLAPFDRLAVRKAINLAADRAAAVEVAGGSDVSQATCQILPPHFPGYRPYCPYGKVPDLAQGAGAGRRLRHQGHEGEVLFVGRHRRARALRREAPTLARLSRLDQDDRRHGHVLRDDRRLPHARPDRDDRVDHRLPDRRGLLQSDLHVRLVPACDGRELERLRVLRPAHRPADRAGACA